MTPTHAAFLRGVNLGRNRRVSSAELVSIFEGMGFDDVATFRTSGNVVLGGKPKKAQLEKGLQEALGYDVEVFLRSAQELEAMARHAPFERAALEASNGKLQVMLLTGPQPASVQRQALALVPEGDHMAFLGNELYWLPKGGLADSDFDLNALAKLIGSTTTRTKGTIELLAAKFFAG